MMNGNRRSGRRGPRERNFGPSDRGFSGRGFGKPGFKRSFSGPREMHKATCADCGKECEVPFKPSGDKPVYCRDCFQKHKPKRF